MVNSLGDPLLPRVWVWDGNVTVLEVGAYPKRKWSQLFHGC